MARLVVTRVLLPGAAAVVCQEETVSSLNCKRSELPLYIPEKELKKPAVAIELKEETSPFVETMENGFGAVRKSISSVVGSIKGLERIGVEKYDDSKKNVQWLIDYLGDDATDVAPKAGAIAIGGLTGFIFALRGGFFRKIIFTSAGALGMASICYPKESAEYSSIAFTETKQYAKIGYNFIYGVKKGDPPLELPSLPKMPNSISEAWGMVSDMSKSTDVKSPVSEKEELVSVEKGGDLSFTSSPVVECDDTDDDCESNIDVAMKAVSDLHDESLYKSCHCPVGGCLNAHEECPAPVVPNSDGTVNSPDPKINCDK